MFKLGLVGDLSQNDPALLARALDAALSASDLVVQLGDVNPGYQAVRDRLHTGKLLVVPGNHDTLGPGSWPGDWPRQWRKDLDACTLIGVDNTRDALDGDGWSMLDAYAKAPRKVPLFLCGHKPISPLVLPDGSESQHIMGEGHTCPDGQRLQEWVASNHTVGGVTVCCGHYHGASVIYAPYGPVILEGRGGAAGPGNVGYTLVLVQPEGWTAHAVTI